MTPRLRKRAIYGWKPVSFFGNLNVHESFRKIHPDAHQIAGIGDIDTFTRFVGLCAGRVGSLLNASSLGADAGITYVTAKRWLSILRASYVLYQLPAHHQNFSKRLIKSPKLYFVDSGLLCRLSGLLVPIIHVNNRETI